MRAEIVITKHAADRAQERCPFGRRGVKSAANRAFDHGRTPAQISNRLTRNSLQRLEKPGGEVRLWGGQVFIFKFEAGRYYLVTVWPFSDLNKK